MDVIVKHAQTDHSAKDPFASFFAHPFEGIGTLEGVRREVLSRHYPRKELSDILLHYNRTIGNDAQALDNVKKIAVEGSCCVITGQQLGFASGPHYTILKAISCLLAAKAAGAIPVFWLATDDHDVNEIRSTTVLDSVGNLKRFPITLPNEGYAVEDLLLSDKNCEEIKHFTDYLGITHLKIPTAGERYADAMARWLTALFSGTGLVFVEPRLLRQLAAPFFVRELEEREPIQTCLSETTKKLEDAGGVPVLKFTDGTNLFLKNEKGRRLRLRWEQRRWSDGNETFTLERLVALAKSHPERFSTNVASRPVLQNLLFPTLAYIAGPAELAYHRQLSDYHSYHGVPMPCIIPRINATLIPPAAAEMFKACSLNPWDDLPTRIDSIEPNSRSEIEAVEAEWGISSKRFFSDDLPAETIERDVRQGAEQLHRHVVKKRLSRQGIPTYALHLMNNLVHPHNAPQERLLNWFGFQAHFEGNLIAECLQKVDWTIASRQYIFY